LLLLVVLDRRCFSGDRFRPPETFSTWSGVDGVAEF
jgi:hypothetical protein